MHILSISCPSPGSLFCFLSLFPFLCFSLSPFFFFLSLSFSLSVSLASLLFSFGFSFLPFLFSFLFYALRFWEGYLMCVNFVIDRSFLLIFVVVLRFAFLLCSYRFRLRFYLRDCLLTCHLHVCFDLNYLF